MHSTIKVNNMSFVSVYHLRRLIIRRSVNIMFIIHHELSQIQSVVFKCQCY